ncbi:MAG: bifunctional ADP-dependent NAD(P)H-hydrate dehydratase/NAD(P)H-hydrate epimerase [Candidatus Thorarchaeota archaeon]|nr:MAG: bifunctional ADP-dependent NAD(P)H-hydrate dehydratase/NAD(P)H-hydrate epimerase [Candidatus Thorarchaeota archaeon]
MQQASISTNDMRILELNAEYLGITLGMLMENAGREVVRLMESIEPLEGKRVAVLCGVGGNGGDGMVASRYLYAAGASVDVLLMGDEGSISNPHTFTNWKILKNIRGISKSILRTESDVKSCKAISKAELLVDAMLGIGQTNAVREPMLTAIKTFNSSKATKYSIDIPTGMDSDTGQVYGVTVRATHTITLHAPKPALFKSSEYVGRVHVVDIGIPKDAGLVCGGGDLWLYTRPRKPTAHKGDFGRILVIGGSDVFSGAPALTAMAALRTGADLVSMVVPDPIVATTRSYSPNLIVHSLNNTILVPESLDSVREVAQQCDAVAIGPGLGQAPQTIKASNSIVQALMSDGKMMVIDADALKALSSSGISLDPDSSIVTPHWGELATLLARDLGDPDVVNNRIERAVEAASKFNTTVLLKGHVDVIAHPDGHYKLNYTGVPAMTVGGTGDVLTGIAATLLSRRHGSFKAASAAAFISGLAGEKAFQELGDHIEATDCIAKIPEVMKPTSR